MVVLRSLLQSIELGLHLLLVLLLSLSMVVRFKMFSLCVVTSWAFSLKSKFLLTFLALEEEEGCSAAVGDIALLFLLPLLGVLEFLVGDFPFSSG